VELLPEGGLTLQYDTGAPTTNTAVTFRQAAHLHECAHRFAFCRFLSDDWIRCPECSRVGYETGLVASYGVNTFVVKYSKVTKDEYPDHVVSATFHGRLISQDTIVNVDISFEHDSKVEGCGLWLVCCRWAVLRVGLCILAAISCKAMSAPLTCAMRDCIRSR
jgi:hypothetical protein